MTVTIKKPQKNLTFLTYCHHQGITALDTVGHVK